MKKFKGDAKTIAEMLIVILIYFGISTLNTPFISYVVIGICIVFWSYGLVEKAIYRRGKNSYILFPTQNDDYAKLTSGVLGVLIIAGCIVFSLFISYKFNDFVIWAIAAGLLIFLNGIFDLPKGRMQLKNDEIIVLGIKEKISQINLKEVEINAEKLSFRNTEGSSMQLENLKIDEEYATAISQYISANKSNKKIAVINLVK